MKLDPLIPLLAKDGTLLPLARPVEYIDSHTMFDVDILVFGNKDCAFTLYEDDGTSFDYEKGMQNKVAIKWSSRRGLSIARKGKYMGKRYQVSDVLRDSFLSLTDQR